jgi:catechol 2,3-dioxygenase-like lactoylglutathione lyase family enzyme
VPGLFCPLEVEGSARPFTIDRVSGVRVSGVSELVLEVSDLAEAERFYVDVLGFPVVERWEREGGEAVWVMAGDRTRIGLWRPQIGLGGGRGGVHVHYALQLEDDDYEPAVARIRSHAFEVYEHDHSTYGRGRGRAAYVTDPAGHVIELWTWDVATHLRELPDSPGSH